MIADLLLIRHLLYTCLQASGNPEVGVSVQVVCRAPESRQWAPDLSKGKFALVCYLFSFLGLPHGQTQECCGGGDERVCGSSRRSRRLPKQARDQLLRTVKRQTPDDRLQIRKAASWQPFVTLSFPPSTFTLCPSGLWKVFILSFHHAARRRLLRRLCSPCRSRCVPSYTIGLCC